MPQHNLLSVKVTLQEPVEKGHIITASGQLASTADATKPPFGVALYAGVTGEDIAICVTGIAEVKTKSGVTATQGTGIVASAGVASTDTTATRHFGIYQSQNGDMSEIVIGTGAFGVNPAA